MCKYAWRHYFYVQYVPTYYYSRSIALRSKLPPPHWLPKQVSNSSAMVFLIVSSAAPCDSNRSSSRSRLVPATFAPSPLLRNFSVSPCVVWVCHDKIWKTVRVDEMQWNLITVNYNILYGNIFMW